MLFLDGVNFGLVMSVEYILSVFTYGLLAEAKISNIVDEPSTNFTQYPVS